MDSKSREALDMPPCKLDVLVQRPPLQSCCSILALMPFGRSHMIRQTLLLLGAILCLIPSASAQGLAGGGARAQKGSTRPSGSTYALSEWQVWARYQFARCSLRRNPFDT